MSTFYKNNRNLAFGFSSLLVNQDPAFIVTPEGDIRCVVTGTVSGKTPINIYCNHPVLVCFVLTMNIRRFTRWFVKGDIDVRATLDPGSKKPIAKLTMSAGVLADISTVDNNILFGEDPAPSSPRNKKKQQKQQDDGKTQGKGLASVQHMEPFKNVFTIKVIEAIIFDSKIPPDRLQKKAENPAFVDDCLTKKYQSIKESFTKDEAMVYYYLNQYFKCRGDLTLLKEMIDGAGGIKRAIPSHDGDTLSLNSAFESIAIGTDTLDDASTKSASNTDQEESSEQRYHDNPEAIIDEYINRRFHENNTGDPKKYEYEITYLKIKKNEV